METGVSQPPLHIVWDLDRTLIGSRQLPLTSEEEDSFGGRESHHHAEGGVEGNDTRPTIMTIRDFRDPPILCRESHSARIRPGAIELLRKLKKEGHRLYVFTSSTRSYMTNVIAAISARALDTATGLFDTCVSRSDFRYPHLSLLGGKDVFVAFSSLFSIDLPPERTILMDDTLDNHRPNPENGFPVTPFCEDEYSSDRGLYHFGEMFSDLSQREDIRSRLPFYLPPSYLTYFGMHRHSPDLPPLHDFDPPPVIPPSLGKGRVPSLTSVLRAQASASRQSRSLLPPRPPTRQTFPPPVESLRLTSSISMTLLRRQKRGVSYGVCLEESEGTNLKDQTKPKRSTV